jgi:hypothetical protein
MIPLLRLPARRVYYLPRTAPAVFYLADDEGGGVLINAPPFSSRLTAQLARVTPPRYLFIPSRFGARHARAWRDAGVKLIAYREEIAECQVQVDIALDRSWRFSRTVDFLPMAGRTAHTCALRCRPKPGILFLGPIFSRAASGWPTLVPFGDDHSYENRVLGAVGLRHLRYEYAFTDDFDALKSRYGPGAGRAIARELEEALQPA